jgi:phenylacetic acid degradation operon negative regulatory protein
MPAQRLVRVGALFGFGEGTVRTALSRMVAAGELRRDGRGRYELAGSLLARQAHQRASRASDGTEHHWDGRWRQAVVPAGARSAGDRAEFRRAMSRLRMAELRDGVWMRPDNLDPRPVPEPRSPSVADLSCLWFDVTPDRGGELAAALWDLGAWAARAEELRREMAAAAGRFDVGDPRALASGFVLSAAVLRHFLADPLLPAELQPAAWPGRVLRDEYDQFDAAYRAALGEWLRVPS